MSEARDLAFPEQPRRILESVEGWLLEHFSKRALVIGGGTVLASRWGHRVSTDCDMFADERAFRVVDADALRNECAAQARMGGLIRARQFRRGLYLETRDGELSLVGDKSRQRRHPTDRIGGFAIHPVDEVLRRKMEFRLVARGLVEVRDLYDFAVAACTETEAMERILWGADEITGEWLDARLRQSSATGSKPLLDPHCSKLSLGLEDFALQLFRFGAVEFNRRHGDMIRKGLSVDQKGIRQ